jgi:hypothetical protein
MQLVDVPKIGEGYEFKPGCRYLVFVDIRQVDFEGIEKWCQEPNTDNIDIQFFPVRSLPGDGKEAVKVFEAENGTS